MKGYADERSAWEAKNADRTWENYEDEVCPKCNGTKKDPALPEDPHCLACEGTGVHYRIIYGHTKGEAYAYIKENGLDLVVEYAKAMREAHKEIQDAGKVGEQVAIKPYVLPKFLQMELQARGWSPDQFFNGSYIREIANILVKEYPAFMCVNYKKF